MSQISTSPYVNFNGHAREAMEFYQAALGGKLDLLAIPLGGGAPVPAGPDDAIMHANLEADGAHIMGSDGMVEYPAKVGDNFAVALSGTDHERLARVFEMLSEGGTVKQNLKQESWGDTFGWFEDKFGINWMVNIAKSEG
jgi:PhnB protein